MSQSFARTLVTAALPYANGPLHLGHLAGAYLPADVFCRYERMCGRDVVFICGSDEHGVPIMLRARAEDVPPQVIVDRYHAELKSGFERFGMSFDYYGRTSSATHRETSQAFFEKLAESDTFVRKTESQLFDPEAGMFLADRFVRGTCPSAECANPQAYGDQCERCGRSLSPSELIDPRSAITDAVPELRETTHWYLPLGKMQPKLAAWFDGHPEWKTNVRGQVSSWLKEGLADRAVTRDLGWGVPVPRKVAQTAGVDAEGKVLYVWFDAPIGYISATREWAEGQGDKERWKAYWQADDTRLIHFIGKDNIVFHCLVFPAMLMAHGQYVLPDNVPANEFLNLEGGKLSTSRGWAVWVLDFLDRYPADYLRYALLRILPETKDSDFAWREMQAHINNELADTLGNFANRSVTFAVRYFDGKVPPLLDPDPPDQRMLASLADYPTKVGQLIESYRFRDALDAAMGLARAANKYFNDAAPWATRKTDMSRCGNTIHVSLQVCATLGVLFEPFLPASAARLRAQLALTGVRASVPGADPGSGIGFHDAGRPLLAPGAELGKPEILFSKIEDAAVAAELDRLQAASRAAQQDEAPEAPNSPEADDGDYAPAKSVIAFDDFEKLDLRVGRVLVAERVKKSKKLIRCEVALGYERRQLLAGVAAHMTADELSGRQVVVVANLAPRKMAGLESQGMLLMAEDRQGRLVPVEAGSEPGATVS